MRPRTLSGSDVTHTGTLATILGAGRPAAVAADSSAGRICVSIAFGPLSQRIVPAVCAPAIRSMRGPIAASITVGGSAAAAPVIPSTSPDQMSPVNDTLRSVSAGSSTERYSSMCFAGVANGTFSVPSIVGLCASPMPSTSRFPIASCTVSACPASISGWRNHVGMTAVPSSIVLVRAPITAMAVSASGTASCASQYDVKPAASASTAWSTMSASGAPMAMSDEPLIPMRISASCTREVPHRLLLGGGHVVVGALPLHDRRQLCPRRGNVAPREEGLDQRLAGLAEDRADEAVRLHLAGAHEHPR